VLKRLKEEIFADRLFDQTVGFDPQSEKLTGFRVNSKNLFGREFRGVHLLPK
jgi:hypothetical protein